ncbi:hypothetical protein ACFQGX_38615 [Nonomuraea dietziae]
MSVAAASVPVVQVRPPSAERAKPIEPWSAGVASMGSATPDLQPTTSVS